ncbi:siroheme synthase [Pyrolobus fumarii 1A]|uniref:precorrin-2 dehydrogenase n=1 Tax=Pyrolobus fumarii (strain DSM 11204 / 1A) TaxID=694429 RepID=G0EGR4_PYRF1|nr:bifunctional precorrin-2 dehydrogenase/sirohydrochlorin ferrochelatase [Pyrolobus fumarii]AEM39212.1 siroheme synthase [Pyrolobus fumarii 1A]
MRLPLWIEAKALNVVVFGGGKVGTRRALKFLDAGARVTVVSLEFSDELLKAASASDRLCLIKGDARTIDLDSILKDAHIVVIAVPDEEARRIIWEAAKRNNALVNDATDAEATEVVVPYEASVNSIRVAVTTEGKSGVTARHALQKIVKLLENDRELATMLEALWWAKRYMKSVIPDGRARFPIYFEIERDPRFMEAVRRGDVEEAKRVAKEIIDAHAAGRKP